MNTLVTGGAGFMGSHIVDSLIEKGHTVLVVDDLSGGYKENLNPKADYVEGSVTDAELLNWLFYSHKFQHVFHAAAYAAEGLSHFIRRYNYTTNLIGSMNVINNAIKYDAKCLVFLSSIAVYGAGQTPMSEDTVPKPEDPYGISKYAVEMDLEAAHKMFGLNYIVFRPHNVYGERQNIGDPYRNVIGIFMNQILLDQPCTIFGDGEQTRAFTYIKDIAPLIAGSVKKPEAYNQIFNIGADHPYSVNSLAEAVQLAMRKWTGAIHLPARNEVLHAFSDHSKLRKVFGEQAETSLELGLYNMAEWVKKVGAKKGKPFEGIEIEKNLPPSWAKMVHV